MSKRTDWEEKLKGQKYRNMLTKMLHDWKEADKLLESVNMKVSCIYYRCDFNNNGYCNRKSLFIGSDKECKVQRAITFD